MVSTNESSKEPTTGLPLPPEACAGSSARSASVEGEADEGLSPPPPPDQADEPVDPLALTPDGDPHATRDPFPAAEASVNPPVEEWPILPGYKILEELGQGGMGRVFKALHLRLNRVVALKIIRPERLDNPQAIRRFQREAKAAARLSHPNIVMVFDADEAGSIHFLAMEYIEGTDLAHLVRTQGPLAIGQACDYVRQACLGLQHAHERGLIHRDIKPSNLLLSVPGGVIKVLDMGLARIVSGRLQDGDSSDLTESGMIMGTPDYVAPEQASDPRLADIRSDIYSLGCTLYYLLAGQPPFPGGTSLDKLVKHASHEPASLETRRAEVPPHLRVIVRRMMAKQPLDRYQTPAEVADALEPFCRFGSVIPQAASSAEGGKAEVSSAPVMLAGKRTEAEANELRRQSDLARASVAPEPRQEKKRRPHFDMRLRFLQVGCSISVALGLLLVIGGPVVYWFTWNKRPFDSDRSFALQDHQKDSRTVESSSPKLETRKGLGPSAKDVPPPALSQVAENDLAEYERHLVAGDWQKAKVEFEKALTDLDHIKPEPKGLRHRAQLGRARALARSNKDWGEVQQVLAKLPVLEPPDQAHREALLVLAEAGQAPPDAGNFDKFLNALTELKKKNLDAEMDAWEKQELQGLTQGTVAQALSATQQLRQKFNPEQPFQPLYKAADAAKVVPWLKTSYELLNRPTDPPSLPLRQELALASYKPPKADATVATLLEDFTDETKPESFPYHWVKAQAQGSNRTGSKAAFESYAALWQLLPNEAKVTPAERYEKILKPALSKGEDYLDQAAGGDEKLGKRLAGLYAAKVELLRQNGPLGAGAEGPEDILKALKRAAALAPVEYGPALTREHINRARKYSQLVWDWSIQATQLYNLPPAAPGSVRENLQLGAEEADAALKDRAAPLDALLLKGQIEEERAWLLGDRSGYKEAIDAFTKAHEADAKNAAYQIARGRCYYKRAIGDNNRKYLDNARQDLTQALGKEPLADQQVEAYFWLGLVYYKAEPPAYAETEKNLRAAIRLAEAAKSFRGPYAYGLEALAQLGDINLFRAKENPGQTGRYVDEAVKCYVDLGIYAKTGENEKNRFYAASLIRWAGEKFYEERKPADPVRAYKVYRQGLPAKIADADVAQLHLLNVRNALLAKPGFQEALKAVNPRSAQQLVEDAKRGLELAEIKHPWISPVQRAEAHVAAGLCYLHAGNKDEARKYFDTAVEFPIEPELKAKIEDMRKKLKLDD